MNAELGVAMDPPELVAKAVCDMLAGGRPYEAHDRDTLLELRERAQRSGHAPYLLKSDPGEVVLAALFRQISGGHGKSGGLGSWWHTPEDTVDKIDPCALERNYAFAWKFIQELEKQVE